MTNPPLVNIRAIADELDPPDDVTVIASQRQRRQVGRWLHEQFGSNCGIPALDIPRSDGALDDVVPFTMTAVMGYLDQCIRYWRVQRDEASKEDRLDLVRTASCYVDAFQSVRSSLFGDTLP